MRHFTRFFHYVFDVESWHHLSIILQTYRTADKFALAPAGWQGWLRPDAFKVFVEISDDNHLAQSPLYPPPDGTTSGNFETRLFALIPKNFGDATDRNYVFHSIVGVASHPLGVNVAYAPTEPLEMGGCATAENVGLEYQILSRQTQGLRFPVCNTASYDVIFQEVAKKIIKGAQIGCQFEVPKAPAPYTVDLQTVTIDYSPGGGGPAQAFSQVPDQAQCSAGKFYIDKAAQRIVLCPDTCNTVRNDDKAKVQVFFNCGAPIG